MNKIQNALKKKLPISKPITWSKSEPKTEPNSGIIRYGGARIALANKKNT